MTQERKNLVAAIAAFQVELKNNFTDAVCENWSLESFLESLDDCICDIESENDDIVVLERG